MLRATPKTQRTLRRRSGAAKTATNTAAKAHTGQDRSKPEGSAHMRPVDGARHIFIRLTARSAHAPG